MKFLLTTNSGIEDIVIDEIKEKLDVQAENFSKPGYVSVQTGSKTIENLKRLRSIHHLLRYLDEIKIEALEDILDRFKQITFPHLEGEETFRITCDRHGTHDFGSMDVEREAGAIFNRRQGLDVDLEDFDYEVYINVKDKSCLFGIKLTREPLTKRHEKIHHHSASVKTNIAYAMIRLANLDEHDNVLDCFTGSGTIPLELRSVSKEKGLNLDIYASDKYERAIEEAKENFRKNRADIETKLTDARDLDEEYSTSFDAIISNLPWGLKSGTRSDLYWLYRKFLQSAEVVMEENGRIIVLVLKKGVLKEAVNKTSFVIEDERFVNTGTIRPKIATLKKEKL